MLPVMRQLAHLTPVVRKYSVLIPSSPSVCGTIGVVHGSFLNRVNARLWPRLWNMLKGVKGTDYGLVVAGTPCPIAIIMCLFLLLQNEIIPGLTPGAVKG